MEEWQKNYISKNMPSLLKEINCDAIILAILEADKVLCEADIDELVSRIKFNFVFIIANEQ